MAANVKSIDIKNRTYYFFNDMINLKNFDLNLLKIDKKSYKDIDIYYVGYITIKNVDNYENIHSVNPLYFITHSPTGHFKEKNDKYLILNSTDKYEEVWSEIRELQKCCSKKELMCQKILTLIKQMYQKNACFVIVGTLKMLEFNLNRMFVINVMMH